jgi:hypothetical protein
LYLPHICKRGKASSLKCCASNTALRNIAEGQLWEERMQSDVEKGPAAPATVPSSSAAVTQASPGTGIAAPTEPTEITEERTPGLGKTDTANRHHAARPIGPSTKTATPLGADDSSSGASPTQVGSNSVSDLEKRPRKLTPLDGSHLASGGVYRPKIVALQARNPNLKHRDWKIPSTREGWVAKSRVQLVKFDKDGRKICTAELNPSELQESLAARTAASSETTKEGGYLYILEGLDPNYVELFGAHLTDIDPAVFSRHQRTALWEGKHRGGNTAKLASLDDPGRSFMMEYCELLYFAESPDSISLRNPADNRHINISRKPVLLSDVHNVGIMHRKASFWAQTHDNGSWEGKCRTYFLFNVRRSNQG